MKKLEVIIPDSARDSVTAALRAHGVDTVVASQVESSGTVEMRCYRGTSYAVDQHQFLKLEAIIAAIAARPTRSINTSS